MLKVQLTRDLRKNILRGHPWVYREAISVRKEPKQASLCEVIDKKGKALAWAIYSPEGPLALRVLSIKKRPPNQELYAERMERAWILRESLRSEATNAYRLFNGEGDRLPGMVCDLYDSVAILQFDGEACFEFWDQEYVAQWLLQKPQIKTVYCKPRRSDSREGQFWGEKRDEGLITIKENDIQFLVNFIDGQKTGFFLDQRDNRQYLRGLSQGKSVLNLFSYTGGFSLYAGKGGAESVTSVDLSSQALELAEKAWHMNGLKSEAHKTLATDVFKYLEEQNESFNIVMVDPPSMTHSEKTKAHAIKAYTDLFAKAANLVGAGDHLVVSSCSSHISFNDFLEIIEEALSQARRTGQLLRISGQGSDHPIPHFCRELRYLKFVDIVLD